MGNTIRRLFNLYPAEGKRAAPFLLLGFLWAVGANGSFTLSDGMFLEQVGAAGLPKSYFIVAVAMCSVAACLILLLRRISISRLFFSVILVTALASATSGLITALFPSHVGAWFWYAYRVVGWGGSIAIYICFWAFIDQYFDLQDAKRFFCLFNSILFLGDATGGAIISLMLSRIGLSGTLALFTCALIVALPLIPLICRNYSFLEEEERESIAHKMPLSFHQILKRMLSSPFTLLLMLFYFAMQLLSITTDYNTMDTFARVLGDAGQKHKIAEFIGVCTVWVSLGNMFFGMFFYSRIVKKLGINNIIIIAPAFFLLVFLLWGWKSSLSVAIFGLVAREGMTYTFDDNNFNLLISGVPTRIKNQVRIAIESFFEPVGTLIAALLLLSFQGTSTLLGLALSGVALLIVFGLRSSYPKAIFRNLVDRALRFEKKAVDRLSILSKKEKKEVEFYLLSSLKRSHNESIKLLAFDSLLKLEERRFIPQLLNQVDRFTLPGKIRAIELLNESVFAFDNLVIERLRRWRYAFPHPQITSTIHFYLAKHQILLPKDILHNLHNPHLGLRGASILALHISDVEEYKRLAKEKLSALLSSSKEQEICMGLRILECEKDFGKCDLLLSFLKHPSPIVHRRAARSIAHITQSSWKKMAPRLISALIDLRDHQARMHCLEALRILQDDETLRPLILASTHFRPGERKALERVVLQMGKGVVSSLIEIVEDSSVHDRCRLLAGKIAGKLHLSRLRSVLYPIVHKEIDRAYFYYYHAHTVQKQIPEHNLAILTNALITGYHSIIDFIVQLLAVAGSIEECEVLSHTLHSKNRKLKAQAIETLQKTCESKVFALLEPLISESNFEKKLYRYCQKGRYPLVLPQLLDALEHSPSLTDQIVSLTLKSRLKVPDWKAAVRKKLDKKEYLLKHVVNELLQYETT